MLDTTILQQVKDVFKDLTRQYTFKVTAHPQHEKAAELKEFINDFVSTSQLFKAQFVEIDDMTIQFSLLKDNEETGVMFRGIPNGHEFTSLLLAVLNADGKGKNLPDDAICRRIQRLKGNIKLQTYVSLTCTNCPDVVQALNVMALISPKITHEMIDGALFQDEVERLNIQAVPTVYANGELLHIGRGSLGELLTKLEDMVGSEEDENQEPVERRYDVVVVGGGPAGASAAIYSARKGLRVAVVASRIGGQVKDTVGIENFISVPKTTGAKMADNLLAHLKEYPIDVFDNRRVDKVLFDEKLKQVHVKGGEIFISPAVIIATGASWRKLNVQDEAKYMGHGVHFCPHCDGPFYKNKHVAVVGGGNSGVEAAIDLAGICKKVTLLEFGETLRADTVLQEKAKSLGNVEIFTMAQTTAIVGDGQKVTAIRVKNRNNDEERDIAVDGIFVQIGLAANADPFREALPLNQRHEIEVDNYCRTTVPGIYAAGDVTNVPYKQIMIAMGEGAKAALSAFDDRIRGVI